MKRAALFAFLIHSKFDINDAPDATFQEALVAAVEFFDNMDFAVPKMIHGGPIFVLTGQETHLNPVDKAVPPFSLHRGLCLVGFVMPKVVGGKRFLYRIDADADFIFAVGSAILSQQVFQDI